MILDPVPSGFVPKIEAVSCGVSCSGRLLFMKRSDWVSESGCWGFPTGKVKSGESFEAAILRELCEETGIETALINLMKFKSYAIRWPRMDFGYHLYLLALSNEPEIRLDSREHSEFCWLSMTEGLSLNLVPDASEILKELILNRND